MIAKFDKADMLKLIAADQRVIQAQKKVIQLLKEALNAREVQATLLEQRCTLLTTLHKLQRVSGAGEPYE